MFNFTQKNLEKSCKIQEKLGKITEIVLGFFAVK